MANMMFVNLPVRDLPRSRRFFEGLGYAFNPRFSDDTAACLVLGETIFAMLLTHPKFAGFTPRPVADATAATEVITALAVDSRAEVDRIADAALAGGGGRLDEPQDHGFMYSRNFTDPDGHIWEFFWMDPAEAGRGEGDRQ